jgi:hypothetical protein
MYHRGNDWQPFAAESYAPPQGSELQAGDQQFANQPIEQSGEHTMGYRGDAVAQPQAGQQAGSQVFVDRCGRHYICENGRRVYVSLEQGEMASSDQGYQQSWSQPTPAEPMPPAEDAEAQDQAQDATAAAAIPPANPTPPAADAEAAAGAEASADVPGVSDRSSIDAPASPREVNNAPDPAPEGRATTGGATDSAVR